MMVQSQRLGLAGIAALTCASNRTRGTMLAYQVKTAETMLDRRMGLLNRAEFHVGEGLHIVPCDSIHTVDMMFPIDVLFLDENGIVLDRVRNIPPGHSAIRCYRSASALELPAGVIDHTGTLPGDVIRFVEGSC